MSDEPGGCLECGHGPVNHAIFDARDVPAPCKKCDCVDYECPGFVGSNPSGLCGVCLKKHGPDDQPSSNAALVHFAREDCGCLGCAGAREIGAHTIATPDNPRPTPTTCLAPVLLKHYLKERDALLIHYVRKERERASHDHRS